MPELPPFNPSVSVFHFNSKVSNAKIQKYKLATERGMLSASQGTERRDTNGEAKQDVDRPLSKSSRFRLKVRPRPTIPDGDVINVARPKQTQNVKKRDWHKAFGSKPPARDQIVHDEDLSSDLSSANSDISSPEAIDQTTQPSIPIQASLARQPSNRESYGDFMSYYVEDGEDEPQESPEPMADDASARPAASKNLLNKAKEKQRHPQAKLTHQSETSYRKQHDTIQTQHVAYPPRPPIQPQPNNIVQLPAFEQFNIGPPHPVHVMIEKLEALSQALTDFGGVPPTPASPELSVSSHPHPHEIPSGAKHNNLAIKQISAYGQHDAALTYGIQFIINALKSWAQQRLTHLHLQALAQGQRHTIPPTLAGTPEGRAIAAFRAVVESGCLRTGAVIPIELSRSLRQLYLQIDHLINQGAKQTPPWRCLSYRAQIEANKIRVEGWKDEQTRAEHEMVRQHQIAHQQVMRQMGLPPQFTSTMFYQQPQDVNVPRAESRRHSQNLIRLPVQASYPPAAAQHIAPALPHDGLNVSNGMTTPHSDRMRLFAKQNSRGVTALLPRSGQSMQFSFPPTTSGALQAFGSQAFPGSRGSGPAPADSAQLAASIAAAVNARVAEDRPPVSTGPKHAGFVAVNAQQV